MMVVETARVMKISTTPRSADPCGQVSAGFLIIRAPFVAVDEPSMEEYAPLRTQNPTLAQRIRSLMTLLSFRAEYEQQHKAHAGQRFAVIRLVRYYREVTSSLDGKKTRLPAASMMLIETTGYRDNEYRRVGLLSIAVPMNPEPGDADQNFLAEMKEAKWAMNEIRVI